MDRLWHRGISVILSLMICVNCLAIPASAADVQEDTGIGISEGSGESGQATPEDAEKDETTETETTVSLSDNVEGTLTYRGDKLTVEIQCTQEDNIPASAQIVFKRISKKHEFAGYWAQAKAFLAAKGCTDMNYAEFWQIGLVADGEPIIPSSELNITVTYKNYTDAVQKGEAETLHLTVLSKNGSTESVAYTVDESQSDGSGGMLIRKITFAGDCSGVFGLIKTPGGEKTASAVDGNCTVEASFGEDAQFPENVTMNVSQVSPSSEAYDAYFNKAQNNLRSSVSGSLVYADFYDVSFLLDGQELEPEAAVDMTLRFEEGILMGQNQSLHVIHFLDDGSWELLPVEITEQEAGENAGDSRVKAISFAQESFSVVGIIVFDKGKAVVRNVDGESVTGLRQNTVITVSKAWRDENGDAEDASVHAGDTVTIELRKQADGEGQYETVSTVILSAANNWTHTFTNLNPQESDVYTFHETNVTSGDSNITATYQSALAMSKTYTESWTQTNTLVDGKYYLIRATEKAWYLRAASSEAALRNHNATTYSMINNLTDTGNTCTIWQAIDNGDGTWSFYNWGKKQYYLALIQSGDDYLWTVSNSKTEGCNLTIANGYISATVGGVTKYLKFPLNDYWNGVFGGADAAGASKVLFYQYDYQLVRCDVTVTNTKNYTPAEHKFSVNAEVGKGIDWLGDGKANPDTDADESAAKTEQDLYRLYLDYKPLNDATGLDLVLALDVSSSMTEVDAKNEQGEPITRAAALVAALESFIPDFLPENTRNRLCIIVFDADSLILQEWTSDSDAALEKIRDENIFNGSGTNYEAGLMRAHEAFTKLGYSINAKAMLFMSDGDPTAYIGGNDGEELGNVTVGLGDDFEIVASAVEQQGGPQGTLAAGLQCLNNDNGGQVHATYAATSFKRHNQDVVIASISYSSVYVTKYLKQIATSENYALLVKEGGKPSELLEQMNVITEVTPSNVSITDVLSENVELYENDPDFKATVTDSAGVTNVLYENGALTTLGKTVLDNTGTISVNGREITLKFNSNYKVEDGNTYTFSFNVRSNQKTFDKYADAKGIYPDTGSNGTDYANNTSSSAQAGYYSNEDTTRVSWSFGDVETDKYYNNYMPVIQVREGSLTIQKVDVNTDAALSGVEFNLYRPANTNDSADAIVAVDGLIGDYVWVAKGTTDNNGTLTLEHLRLSVFDTGYVYYLVETKPMTGYMPIDPIKLTLYQDGVTLNSTYDFAEVLPNGVLQIGNEAFTTFTFTKVDAEDTAKQLKGAEFVIYRLACTNSDHDHDGLLDLKNVGDCWVLYDRQTTGEDGKISVELPINSDYRLIETKAPGGYTLPVGQWTISIGVDDSVSITAVAAADGSQPPAFAVNEDGTYKVTNMKPMQIPTTGGYGIGAYHLLGLLVMASGILLGVCGCRRKKTRNCSY